MVWAEEGEKRTDTIGSREEWNRFLERCPSMHVY